ncbi:HD domain-containing protein [Vibrio sp. 16]|uniref:HD domain-containing phosphohydrolase n=1 Tax=Vibrio sp. 16 TaxID=391586 RepID=UPI002FEFEAF3
MEAIGNINNESFSVDLKHALIWVARALDYVGVDDIHHNHRVGYISYECAKLLNWDVKKQEFCFLAGLIHDCGVSQTEEHTKLVSKFKPDDPSIHCIHGYHALRKCNILAQFANIVRHHHTAWDILEGIHLSPFEKDIAALIFIADRLDVLRARHLDNEHSDLITLKKRSIAEQLRQYKGTLFRPDYIEAMSELTNRDGFWFSMEPENIEAIPLSFTHLDWLQQDLTIDNLVELGTFIAGIVDAKSPFTYQHSIKVAELCKFLATRLKLPAKTTEQLYVAGLVHDIGKLRTPDEILHKQGSLTKEEYTRIRRHTIDTEIALKMVFPGSKIGEWATNHHERIDGSGYPNNKQGDELDLPSRIIAIVDVFQALSQDRPYRSRLSKEEIVEIMYPMVKRNELDKDVYHCLEAHLEQCYQLSTDLSMNAI